MDNKKRTRYVYEDMTRKIELELILDQILTLIQIAGKRRLGVVIAKQEW